MIASVSLNDVLRDEQQNERIIIFSSSILRFISNIPNLLISVIAIPFLLLMIPILNWMLSSHIRKTLAMIGNLQRDIQDMDYQSVKKIHSLFAGLKLDTTVFDDKKPNLFTRGLITKLEKIFGLYEVIKKSLEDVLFVDVSGQPELSEQERIDFEALNEIWGDDDDDQYAKMTFNQLKKGK